MPDFTKEITPVNIENEMERSYIDYAMSVIVSRALPDVRDGLKPVHRRILFAMKELGNDYNKPYKKSARVVGDVIGKYHPHGDSAVYEAIVRMAQSFSLRYPLICGQGNFGSVDGDSAAAMRYTEVRLAKIGHFLLNDLDKETVDFAPNYDGTEFAPVVLPAAFPQLLVNGSSGIAVGMATNVPPHNLSEVVDGCVAIIDNPELSFEELLRLIPGPDFPTAGIIRGRSGIREAYLTGRGKIVIRSRVKIETRDSDKQSIVVTELPYQVNKAALITKIAELVKEKRVDGITAVRDESDKEGIRVVIEVRRGEMAEVILNRLFLETQLQVAFGVNMVALDNGQPRTLSLRKILDSFLNHRREVITRRCVFELREARARAHVLEGLTVALINIDEVIALIKAAKTPSEAKAELLKRTWRDDLVKEMIGQDGEKLTRPEGLSSEIGIIAGGYQLSEAQAQAILELKLHRLTGLEKNKLHNEYKELLNKIKDLLDVLTNRKLLQDLVKQELLEVKRLFGDKRLTEITDQDEDVAPEDLVAQEDVVLTLSHEGYVKIQSIADYQVQRRGGKGRVATKVRDEDFVEQLFIANTHDTLLCFSSTGKVYWLKVFHLPFGSKVSRGRPLVNLLPLATGEKIHAVLPIKEFDDHRFVFMATADGTVKKVALSQFAHPRSNGIIAIELREGDKLIGVALTAGNQEIMLFSDAGRAVRIHESQVRAVGRGAIGVRGMTLGTGQKVISLVVVKNPQGTLLIANESGYGKRTKIVDFPSANRGAKGVIAIRLSARNGKAVAALEVEAGNQIMLISNNGTLVRTSVDEVSVIGRDTQGVKLMNVLDAHETLIGIERIENEEGNDATE